MPFFCDADELRRYVGGILRAAGEHPETGAAIAASGLTIRLSCTDPDERFLLRTQDAVDVLVGEDGGDADVELVMPADIADRFWRGEYNLAVGIARGTVEVHGDVDGILALAPAMRPLFPTYRKLIAAKDRRLHG